MTKEIYEQAGAVLEKVKSLQAMVNKLEAISLYNPEKSAGTVYERTKRVLLRFLNLKRSQNAKEEAAILLFDGVSIHGTDVPIDDELLPVLRAHFERKLREAEAEFERLGAESQNTQT